jgi:hypothetical protein
MSITFILRRTHSYATIVRRYMPAILNWELIYEATALIPGFGDPCVTVQDRARISKPICDVTEARWERVIRPAMAGGRRL